MNRLTNVIPRGSMSMRRVPWGEPTADLISTFDHEGTARMECAAFMMQITDAYPPVNCNCKVVVLRHDTVHGAMYTLALEYDPEDASRQWAMDVVDDRQGKLARWDPKIYAMLVDMGYEVKHKAKDWACQLRSM